MNTNNSTHYLIRAESLTKAEVRQLTIAMRSGLLLLPRNGEYWDKNEVEALEIMAGQGYSISHIAIVLERSESAIYQQMAQQDSLSKPFSPQTRVHVPKPPVCLCGKCKCDPTLCPRQATVKGGM